MKLLTIPSLWIFVPLFERKAGNGQDIVDRADSAVFFCWDDLTIIVDHSHQNNFSNLNKAIPGRTKLYIYSKGTKRYICDKTEVGHLKLINGHNMLYDKDWQSVYHQQLDGLIVYTCIKRVRADVIDIRLTHWREV